MVIGTGVIFILGVGWLAIVLGDAGKAFAAGVLPFLVGEAVKIALATAVLPVAWRLVSAFRH